VSAANQSPASSPRPKDVTDEPRVLTGCATRSVLLSTRRKDGSSQRIEDLTENEYEISSSRFGRYEIYLAVKGWSLAIGQKAPAPI
jgi:hypothetical protein